MHSKNSDFKFLDGILMHRLWVVLAKSSPERWYNQFHIFRLPFHTLLPELSWNPPALLSASTQNVKINWATSRPIRATLVEIRLHIYAWLRRRWKYIKMICPDWKWICHAAPINLIYICSQRSQEQWVLLSTDIKKPRVKNGYWVGLLKPWFFPTICSKEYAWEKKTRLVAI